MPLIYWRVLSTCATPTALARSPSRRRGESGTVMFIADDEARAQTVLQNAGIESTMRAALTVRMEN